MKITLWKATFAYMETVSEPLKNNLSLCPACGGQNWKLSDRVKDFSISEEWFELRMCDLCHLKATFPQPSEEEIGRYYASEDYVSHSDTKSGLINRLYHAARVFMLKKKHQWVVDASGKSKGALLDVGAGTGHFPHYMKLSGWLVTGLEPDEKARKIAAEKLNMEIDPIENLATLPAAQYDVITMWHVLEHVHDLKGYMERFRAILKPGGVLIIAVPNHTSSDAKKYGEKWAAYDVPRHLWHFSPKAMESLLHQHQFELINKLSMPLDAFYVSMLSEKYKGRGILGTISAFFAGLKTYFSAKKNVDNASSIIYIAK